LQLAVRAGLVDDGRQVLRQEFQGFVYRDAEVLRELLHLRVAQDRAELVGRDRHVLAVTEPRANLIAEAALLQLGNETVEIAEIGLCQNGGDQRRYGGGFRLAQNALERAAEVIEQSHGILQ
jgi:predicted GNAT family N-acyltransferase